MTKLADAYDNLAEAAAALALELRATSPQEPAGAFADGTPVEEPPEWEPLNLGPNEMNASWPGPGVEATKPAGSAAVCPAHNILYLKGRYGMYCPSLSDDPNWSNQKGYCTVTPKSAAAWLRQHA